MISQSRYVDIVSGVGASANLTAKSLTLRIITPNVLLPPGTVVEFSGSDMADDAETYFGSSSEEYKRTLAYSSFISKQINSPSKISFSRWVNSDIAPQVIGDNDTKSLSVLSNVSAGTLTITVNGSNVQITKIDLTTATSLSLVASLVQTAIRSSSDAQLKNATVTFNTDTNQFILTGSVTGSGDISVIKGGNPASATDIAAYLGWGTTDSVNVSGQTAVSPAQAVQASINVSNNFGSFIIMGNSDINNIVAVSQYNHSKNNQYIYSLEVTSDVAKTLSPLIIGYSGTAINIKSSTLAEDYVDQCPCEILAATDYTQENSTQNFMFYQFASRNVTVNDDSDADAMDALRVNYIGQTQVSGQQIAFYQRGILMGANDAAVDMNTYANEMWLKSSIAASIMSFFISSGRVPANDSGKGQILAVIQTSIDQSKSNGVISAGKSLNTNQQLYITTVSGDKNAWRQVQSIGYWINVVIESYTDDNNGLTQYKAAYTLIYSKDDAIRKVTGQDILI